MKIAFFNECGAIPEIGTGHRFRANILSEELVRRGHTIVGSGYCDLVIIDHMFSQKQIINEFKKNSGH